ncbi:MAG: hypothetical protein HRT89_21320, partial [Lentisphaeria bacterium]|nr:hypothetical protein [Lentisphaeria bacterium]NQZ70602.1 hypothetical protein [Lentisphaeria bacterium]
LIDTDLHHIAFIVDGGSKIISVIVDGILCDGAEDRQYGWGRFHPTMRDARGAEKAQTGPGLKSLRLYDRYLRTSEVVGNHRYLTAAQE